MGGDDITRWLRPPIPLVAALLGYFPLQGGRGAAQRSGAPKGPASIRIGMSYSPPGLSVTVIGEYPLPSVSRSSSLSALTAASARSVRNASLPGAFWMIGVLSLYAFHRLGFLGLAFDVIVFV